MAQFGILLCLLFFQAVLSQTDYWDGRVRGDYWDDHRDEPRGKDIWKENKSDYWKATDNANDSYPDRTVRQLLDFKLRHPKPIGLLTLGSGVPVEVRDMMGLNSDLFKHDFLFETLGHLTGETVPARTVLPKGQAVWGYFEVTNDVSKYTSADVFNRVGKKTKVLTRFSTGPPGTGGSDLGRDFKAMAVKFYTRDGILDILNLQTPTFAHRDPTAFADFAHTLERRNPKTNILDLNALFDIVVTKPTAVGTALYILSDFGLPRGWRRSDFFPIHTYELNNKYGERWYVRFSWRTEQGFDYISTAEALLIGDPDFYLRDMYNAVENGSFPAWRLDMDVLSLKDIQTVKYDPFDVTMTWPNGTYQTVTIGRMVMNKISDNQFRDSEQGAWNPSNLVPGIPGPVDALFKGRRFAYRDVQNYRIGRNHLKVGVNSPGYAKEYVRDGRPPVGENGNDAPTYYPNSFHGPLPYVDVRRPKEELKIFESNAADLQFAADFYNSLDELAKTRLATNVGGGLSITVRSVQERTLKLLFLVSPDLATRANATLQAFLLAFNTVPSVASYLPGFPVPINAPLGLPAVPPSNPVPVALN